MSNIEQRKKTDFKERELIITADMPNIGQDINSGTVIVFQSGDKKIKRPYEGSLSYMIDYNERLNMLLTYIKQMSFSWDFFEFDFQENRNFLDYYFWDEYYDDVKSFDVQYIDTRAFEELAGFYCAGKILCYWHYHNKQATEIVENSFRFIAENSIPYGDIDFFSTILTDLKSLTHGDIDYCIQLAKNSNQYEILELLEKHPNFL